MNENEIQSQSNSFLNKKYKNLLLSKNRYSSAHKQVDLSICSEENVTNKTKIINDEQLLKIFDVSEYRNNRKYDSSGDNNTKSLNSYTMKTKNIINPRFSKFKIKNDDEKEIELEVHKNQKNDMDNIDMDLSEDMPEFKRTRKEKQKIPYEKEFEFTEELSNLEESDFYNMLENDCETLYTRDNTTICKSYSLSTDSHYFSSEEMSLKSQQINYSKLYEKDFILGLDECSYINLIMNIFKTKYKNIFDISTYFIQSMIVRLENSIKKKTKNSDLLDIHILKPRLTLIKKYFSTLCFNTFKMEKSKKPYEQIFNNSSRSNFNSIFSGNDDNIKISKNNENSSKNEEVGTETENSRKNSIKHLNTQKRNSNIRQMCINMLHKTILLLINSLFLLIQENHNLKISTIKFKSHSVKKNLNLLSSNLESIINYENKDNAINMFNFSVLSKNKTDNRIKDFICMILFGFLGTNYEDSINQYFNSMLFENIQLKNKFKSNCTDKTITEKMIVESALNIKNLKIFGKNYVYDLKNSHST